MENPGKYTDISFLASSAQGASDVSVTLNYTDGTSELALAGLNLPDWFNHSSNVAIQGLGRVQRVDSSNPTFGNGSNPKLYEFAIPGVDPEKKLESITFDKTSNSDSRAGIFAVSGKPVPPPVPLPGAILPLVLLLMVSYFYFNIRKVL